MPLQPLPKSSVAPEIVEPLCAVFRRRLKGEGQKYTPERAQILDIVTRRDGLFQAEEVQEDLRRAGFRVSKATVYRTIRLLQDSGIIQRVLVDADQAHYQLAYGRTPADLLTRLDTHETIAIDVPELIEIRERICRERGLKPVGHRFHIFATS